MVIIILKSLKQVKHEQLINVIVNKKFQTVYLKKPKNDICLADAFLGCGHSVYWQFG
jgi:hypothetical protein